MGYLKEPEAALDHAWQHHRREVRRLHEKLFYRPLLAAVAKIPGPEVRLSSEAAGDRLAALGYADPQAALRNLEALTSGVSRTASIQKALLPALLQWFAEGPDPDAGCSASAGSARPSAARRGTSGRFATRARSPSGSRTCSPRRATSPTCSSASRRACGCWATT